MCAWAEETRREIMWNENSGKEEASLSEPNKEKSSALSWRMESAGSHQEDKKVKVKIVLIWNTIAHKKKELALSISREKVSGPQIILIPAHPKWTMTSRVGKLSHFNRAGAQNGRPHPWLATALLQLGDIFLTALTQPNFMWTLHVFSWLSGTNPSGLRLELLGHLSRPNYAERHIFFFSPPHPIQV